MADRDSIDVVIEELAKGLTPLRQAVSSANAFAGFAAQLGWSIDDLPAPLQTLIGPLDDLIDALGPIVAGREPGLLEYDALRQAITKVATAIDALEGASYDPALAAEGFAAVFPRQLTQFLIVRYLIDHRPALAFVLRVLGLLRVSFVPRSGARLDHTRWELAWPDFTELLRDPATVFRRAVAWGTAEFAAYEVLQAVQDLMTSIGAPSVLEELDPQIVRILENGIDMAGDPVRWHLRIPLFSRASASGVVAAGIGVFPLPPDGALLPGLALLPSADASITGRFEITDGLFLTIEGTLDLLRGVAVLVRPDRAVEVVGGLTDGSPGPVTGALSIRLDHEQEEPRRLIALRNGSRLEFARLSAVGGLRLAGDQGELFAEIELHGGRLVIAHEAGDSFLQSVTPPDDLAIQFDIALGLSTTRGLYFRGSSLLEQDIPTHLSVGPIEVQSISIAVRPDGDQLPILVGASISARLGPITATITGIGLRARLTFPGSGGNLGPLDVDLDFKPPEGIGLVVDAGAVTGGGFLNHDPATGRYVGALEIEAFGVAVKAFGILDTRLPGGHPAYSFVILVSAEFSPIQLGFGFTLNGVGGLAGIHRRVAVDVFRNRLGQGTLDHLLFPAHPVQDAPLIASDLSAVFPPAENRYVFGPMAILAWGGAGLLEGRLGILLEIPDPVRLVLLGQFRISLPRKEAALVTLNLDLVGEIEPARQRFALDGRLHDSNVVGFPIEAELAVRVTGGSDPSFALSIGGFHPSFTPPAGFPKLKRVTIAIGLDDNPRVTLEGYLALTSNTLQVGALATVYASAGWFNITGHVGFNALFTFSPFSFLTDFSGKVALNKGDSQIAAISLDAMISGPTPWHVAGEACLEIRWFPDICVGVHATFGEDVKIQLPTVDPFPPLRDAIANPESWSGERPRGVFRSATMAPRIASGGAPGRALLDPAQGATLRQTVVPLDRTITRFGASQPPGGTVRFDVGPVTVAGAPTGAFAAVQDLFAPAQFEDLTDDEKLTRPDFERMDAGITLARDAVAVGGAIGAPVEYETRIIDSAFATRHGNPYHPTHDLLLAGALASAELSELRNSGPSKFAGRLAQPPLATLLGERFVVASTTNLGARPDIVAPVAKGAAFQALAAHLASHPEERGRLQVVSLDELKEAA